MSIQEHNELVQSPSGLIAQALSQNASIETLEKLMALEERYFANKARGSYYESLSLLQSEMPDFKRTKKVKFKSKDSETVTEYSYTPLGEMIKALKPLLKKYGFSYHFQFTPTSNGMIRCDCITTHKDGHQEITSMEAVRDESGKKNHIQSIGSTRTYLQRYTLKAAFGIGSDEDDNDGRSAAAPSKNSPIPEPQKKTTTNYLITDPEPMILKQDPRLSDPTWFIQSIESITKEDELTKYVITQKENIQRLSKQQQNLIGKVYQVQLKKIRSK